MERTIVLKLVYVVIWGMQNISKVFGYVLLLISCFKKMLFSSKLNLEKLILMLPQLLF